MNNGWARSSRADAPAGGRTLAGPGAWESRCHDRRDRTGASERGGQSLWRRRLRHDIRHELGTIIMLASAVVVAEDIGDTSRARIDQLLGETRWLDHLLRRLDEDDDDDPMADPERIRVDDLTAEVVAAMRLVTTHEVRLTTGEAWAHIDPVALWRVVRNVIENACRVAEGRVDVSVESGQGRLVIQVDDDGPGFGAGWGAPPGKGPVRPGLASLGLGIVHDLISGYGGSLEIRTCEMGGARVRVLLPAAPPPEDRPAGALADPHVEARTEAPGEARAEPHADALADDWRPLP
ncbi:sensor histidine kinase KdpD [Actinomadura sp. WMMA1423]|uniref:sensor histidine kinase n=1 Tax=Actinomadura sp. WMMA1423 TaxID=2591108 RepID=UPI0011477184|nr:sensor histidine kinase [Actinomadura sp. WMMA1423]